MKQKMPLSPLPEAKNIYYTWKFKWVSFVYEG